MKPRNNLQEEITTPPARNDKKERLAITLGKEESPPRFRGALKVSRNVIP